jgi:DNA polymerase-3 subunit gamma/tau
MADAERRGVAQSHPLVQAVLAAFPGTVIETVRDAGADAYGLVGTGPAAAPPEPEDATGISDESEPADYDDVPPPDDDR